MDLSPINSMKQIRKLEIDYMTDDMVTQLQLKEMREFHFKINGYKDISRGIG
jgi:hypothetical protein